MSFQVGGLDPELFSNLAGLSNAALAARGVQRIRAAAKPGAPCRVSLDDAEVGELVLLLSYEHQAASTPYRQQGPIFVREHARRLVIRDEIPPALARRPLSLRGFDGQGMMVDADLCDGARARGLIERLFENSEVAYIHAHYARRGCFAALIQRD